MAIQGNSRFFGRFAHSSFPRRFVALALATATATATNKLPHSAIHLFEHRKQVFGCTVALIWDYQDMEWGAAQCPLTASGFRVYDRQRVKRTIRTVPPALWLFSFQLPAGRASFNALKYSTNVSSKRWCISV